MTRCATRRMADRMVDSIDMVLRKEQRPRLQDHRIDMHFQIVE
jgi:hypothetical protein